MNSHDQIKKLIPLYLYEELDAKQTEQVRTHLEACSPCSEHLAELEGLHRQLDRKISLEPSEATLGKFRLQLRNRLRNEQIATLREPWWERVAQQLYPRNIGFQLAGATLALVLGVILGKFVWQNSPSDSTLVSDSIQTPDSQLMAQPLIENIDVVEYEPATGNVTIKYKSVNDVLVQGHISDEPVRRILAHTIRAETHPGRRLAAVKAFGDQTFSDSEVEGALIFALHNDDVDGVRLRAAKVLKSLPMNQEIKQAFIHVLLKDSNPALRMEAVEALRKVQESGVVPIFQNASSEDENEFIRLEASKELERRENPIAGQNDQAGQN